MAVQRAQTGKKATAKKPAPKPTAKPKRQTVLQKAGIDTTKIALTIVPAGKSITVAKAAAKVAAAKNAVREATKVTKTASRVQKDKALSEANRRALKDTKPLRQNSPLEQAIGKVNADIYRDKNGNLYSSSMRKYNNRGIKQSSKVNLRKARVINTPPKKNI